MSKAPTENKNMQAVKPRPWDYVIDTQELDNDWLTPLGRARAKMYERMKEHHLQHAAEMRAALHKKTTDDDPDQPRDPAGEVD